MKVITPRPCDRPAAIAARCLRPTPPPDHDSCVEVLQNQSVRRTPDEVARAAWPHTRVIWTPGDWQIIKREFGVTDVVTPADWRLNRRVIATSDNYALYGMR